MQIRVHLASICGSKRTVEKVPRQPQYFDSDLLIRKTEAPGKGVIQFDGSGGMNTDRWRRVEEVYDAVLMQSPERRAAILEELCAADAELREEVEGLLAARDRAGDFLSPDNLQSHIARFTAEAEPLVAGKRLGDYEIRAAIGAGAMGEVYRARDTRLDRDVALKILPAHLVHGADQRRPISARSQSCLGSQSSQHRHHL